MPRSGKLPVLNLPTGQKISIFAQQEGLVVPIHVKFGTADGTTGPLGRAKFRIDRCTGVGTRPPKVENFYFLEKSRPSCGANSLTDFHNF